jgi:hypothetical protein
MATSILAAVKSLNPSPPTNPPPSNFSVMIGERKSLGLSKYQIVAVGGSVRFDTSQMDSELLQHIRLETTCRMKPLGGFGKKKAPEFIEQAMFKELSPNTIDVPRFAPLFWGGDVVKQMTTFVVAKQHDPKTTLHFGEPIAPGVRFIGTLYDTDKGDKIPQRQAAAAIFRQWNLDEVTQSGTEVPRLVHRPGTLPGGIGAVMALACGFGKTRTALWILHTLGRVCLWIVSREDLGDQCQADIHQLMPEARVGWIGGTKRHAQEQRWQDCDIIIGTVQTLVKRFNDPDWCRENSGLFDRIGLVVWDECHHCVAKSWSSVLERLGAAYRLGLSATPHLTDGRSRAIGWLMGKVAYEARRPPGSQEVQVDFIDFQQGRQQVFLTNGEPCRWKMVQALCTDDARNRLLITLIKNALDEGRSVLVLLKRVIQLKMLHYCFEGYCSVDAYWSKAVKKTNAYTQVSLPAYRFHFDPEDKRQRLLEDEERGEPRLVLRTDLAAQEGMNKPWLNTLIRDEVGKNAREQSSGRILRENATNHVPRIIAIRDPYSFFADMSLQSERYYRQQGWSIRLVQPPPPVELHRHQPDIKDQPPSTTTTKKRLLKTQSSPNKKLKN